MMPRLAVLAIAATATLVLADAASAQARTYTLETVAGLRVHNVKAEPATHRGQKGVRVTQTDSALRDFAIEPLAVIEGLEFTNGVIEAHYSLQAG